MALNLKDCPPSLRAAIEAQLLKEGRHLPTTIIRYAMAYQVAGEWRVGPETEDLELIQRLVGRMQTQTGRTAYLAAKGTPSAVVVKLTRVTQPMASKGAP
jgi:hypothetical protein